MPIPNVDLQIRIEISAAVVCNDLPLLFTSYSLKNVDEEKEDPTTIVVYDDDDDEILEKYQLDIVEIFPQAKENGPFAIDNNGNLIMNTVNREDDIFKGMRSPQYRVTIELVKKGDKTRGNKYLNKTNNIFDKYKKNYADEDDQCVIMPQEIQNLQRTVVTIMINDINDNEPKFESENLIIGYPDRELASVIAPPYLTVVQVRMNYFLLIPIL